MDGETLVPMLTSIAVKVFNEGRKTMSNLYIQLISAGQIQRVLSVKAEDTIITDLTISSASSSLPTLVSTENIVGQINDAGFELNNSNMVNKISNLINSYYLPTECALWHDMTIELDATLISYQNVGLYQEIGYMRGTVIQSIQKAQSYESQGNYAGVRVVQDDLVDSLRTRVQSKRSWWERIPEFLIKTAIPFVFSAFMGFSLHILFASIFGTAFHINPNYL